MKKEDSRTVFISNYTVRTKVIKDLKVEFCLLKDVQIPNQQWLEEAPV